MNDKLVEAVHCFLALLLQVNETRAHPDTFQTAKNVYAANKMCQLAKVSNHHTIYHIAFLRSRRLKMDFKPKITFIKV